MKIRQMTAGSLPRMILASAVAATLGACGGGAGGGAGDGLIDENLDGIADVTLTTDLDNDGLDDVDVNGDGEADFDVNEDGIRDTDVDGNGSVDATVLDEFGLLAGFDTDGDDVADLDIFLEPIVPTEEEDEFLPVSAENPCGSANGTDNNSSDDIWANNCTITRTNQHNESLYSAGIQRIVHCANNPGATAASVDSATDADFGPGTEMAVEAFQAANGLTADGAVGAQTWPVLRDALLLSGAPMQDGEQEEYGVNPNCADLALFLGEVDIAADGNGGFEARVASWQLTQGATDASPVAFSVGLPATPLD